VRSNGVACINYNVFAQSLSQIEDSIKLLTSTAACSGSGSSTDANLALCSIYYHQKQLQQATLLAQQWYVTKPRAAIIWSSCL
jgi:hypothetical protein